MTTKGWYSIVEWKNDTTTWVPLKDIKEDSPIQVAEDGQVNDILNETSLA